MNPVLLFDGHCGLCTRSVQFVLRHDRRALFRFAAIQSEFGQALYRRHGLDPAAPSTLLLAEGGRVRTKGDAAVRIAVLLGWPWKALGVLRLFPRRLLDWGYDQVARRRLRLFGAHEACWLPRPEWKDRFLG